MTERAYFAKVATKVKSDIHKYSICNIQYSIP